MKRSPWAHSVNLTSVFHNDDLIFTDKRDALMEHLNGLLDHFPEDYDLEDLLYSLSATEDEDEWDDVWQDFCDWADDNRVWIETVV